MSDFNFHKAARRFLVGESRRREPSMESYLRSLAEMLESIPASSRTVSEKKEMTFEILRGVKRQYRRLREENKRLTEERDNLQERLRLLEENKEVVE